jgi:hypothetical protein
VGGVVYNGVGKRPEGDSPIFAAKAAKIGTVPVNGYRKTKVIDG